MSAFQLLERFAHKHGSTVGRVAILLILVFLWVPIGVLVIMSFAKSGVLSFPPQEFSLKWYGVFLQNEAAQQAIFTSLKVGVPATVISVSLATLIAYAVTRYKFVGKQLLQMLAVLPIIAPLIVVGVAMVLFWGMLNIGNGYHSVLIGHVIRTIPFGTLILIAVFLSFDETLEEASRDLGANELQTFRKVTIPNILPGIIAAGMITFTVSFNEFVYTYFIRSRSTTTLPVYIWGRIRFNVSPEVNVMSVVFLLIAIGMILVALAATNIERLTLQ
jgi:spermidine/putrescine transport system permease protein